MKTTPLPVQPRLRRWPYRLLWTFLAAAFAFSLLLNCTAVSLLQSADLSASSFLSGDKPEDEFPDFRETPSYGTSGPKVLRIPLEGEITRSSVASPFSRSFDPAELVIRQIRRAAADPDAAAILLEVDSPGGGLTASDEIYHELLRFKEADTNRVVVGLVRDMAASGAYYALLPADHIVAQPTALIGSVGVILPSVNASALADRIGVADASVKSGDNKDLLNPLRPVDPAHVAILQTAIDASYERFLSLVAAHRHRTPKHFRPLCDGRVFPAAEALKLGFVDSVGYREDALGVLASLLDVPEVRLVRYERPSSFLDDLFSLASPLAPLARHLSAAASHRPLALWTP
jgi:protease-4